MWRSWALAAVGWVQNEVLEMRADTVALQRERERERGHEGERPCCFTVVLIVFNSSPTVCTPALQQSPGHNRSVIVVAARDTLLIRQ